MGATVTLSRAPRVLCLGNCQAKALSDALVRMESPAAYLHLLTTAFPRIDTPRPLFAGLSRFLPKEDLERMFSEKAFLDITRREDLASVDCDAVLVSLFHEAPLCRDMDRNYPAFINPGRLAALDEQHPPLAGHLRRSFAPLPLNHGNYAARFGRMLGQLREIFPGRPLVVLKRLSHHAAFGTTPHSYLHCWESQSRNFPFWRREWSRIAPDLRLLDLDRVLAGSITPERRLDSPFLFFRVGSPAPTQSIPPSLDLEHLEDAVWDHAARSLLALLGRDAANDEPGWQTPDNWSRGPDWWDCGPGAVASDAAAGRTRKALVRALAAEENLLPILMEHEAALNFSYKSLDFFQKVLTRFPDPAALSWFAGALCDSMRQTLPGFSRNYGFMFARRALRLAEHFQSLLAPADRQKIEAAAAPLLAPAANAARAVQETAA